jgi:hypothetical protein
MTFGESNRSPRLNRPAWFFAWSVFLCLAPMSLAGTSPQTEREGGSTRWNAEQLIESLAKNRQAEVRFEETAFSNLLTEPLKTQGIMRFTPPARLEKHVTAPYDERYLVDGDKVLFERKTKGINRTLSLQDYPALQAFVEAFRSTLANDVGTLKRFYSLTLQGEPSRWVLVLRPLDKATQELVESIRFSGEGGQMRVIEILATDGDRSVMVIKAGTW